MREARPPYTGRSCRRPKPLVAVVAALLAITLLVYASLAQSQDADHGHAPLAVDTTLTLAAVVDATIAAYPVSLEIAAREIEADAWGDRGRSLVAAQPAVMLRYQTDRFGDDLGLSEIESGIQLALWNWGQRKATRQVGEALDMESNAAALSLRWQVTGLLRELIWQMAGASGELDIARESSAVAEQLAAAIRRRQQLGDVALRDVLLADSARLDAEAQLVEAEVALIDAERAYRNLTGLDRRPDYTPEELTAQTEIEAWHPALSLAEAEVERAKSRRNLAERSGTASPTLTVGPRRERSVLDQRYEDSIGMTFSVPFGGSSHVRTREAEAGREVAAAQASLQQVLRTLDLSLHEAAHGLEVARENLGLARERAELSEEGFRIGESAYAKGELSLIELLSLRSVLLDAKRRALLFEIEEQRQTALYNQALGVMP